VTDSSNTVIEIDSDSDNTNSSNIIDEHHETTGIEVNLYLLYINSLINY
jgi:hypothetical protein